MDHLDPNETIDIEEWSICGGGWLEVIYLYAYTYSKTSLNRSTMEPTLSGSFMEMVGLGS